MPYKKSPSIWYLKNNHYGHICFVFALYISMLAKIVKDVTIFTDSLYKRKQVSDDGDRKEVATAEDKDTSGVISDE